MKVFAIVKVSYDWWCRFTELQTVGADLDKLKSNFNDLPMFSSDQAYNDDLGCLSDGNGPSHYYYEEYDV